MILEELQVMFKGKDKIDANSVTQKLYRKSESLLEAKIKEQQQLIERGLPPILEKTLSQETIELCEARVLDRHSKSKCLYQVQQVVNAHSKTSSLKDNN